MNDVRQILRSNYSPSLYLEMTNDCNLNCKYCYIHDKKFNSKVIVMLGIGKKHLRNHYIEDGFTDVILKENIKDELKEKIELNL